MTEPFGMARHAGTFEGTTELGLCVDCDEPTGGLIRRDDGTTYPQCHGCYEAAARQAYEDTTPRDIAERLPTQPAGTQPTGERPLPLVDGLLSEGELLVLGAARGIGKSW